MLSLFNLSTLTILSTLADLVLSTPATRSYTTRTDALRGTTQTFLATTLTQTLLIGPVKPGYERLWTIIKTAPDSTRGYASNEDSLSYCIMNEDTVTFGHAGSSFEMLNGGNRQCHFWERNDCTSVNGSGSDGFKILGFDKWTHDWSYRSFKC